MKRALFLVLGVALLAVSAVAIVPITKQPGQWGFPAGVYIGSTTNSTTNRVARVMFSSQVAMFYTDGGLGCTLPSDAGVATVTGAVVGDHCDVTMPALSHPGSLVDCSVLVANTAQLRHCALQANVDAGQLTYQIEVTGHGT